MESNSTINPEQPATSPAPAAAPAAVISIEADLSPSLLNTCQNRSLITVLQEADALDHDSAFGDDASYVFEPILPCTRILCQDT